MPLLTPACRYYTAVPLLHRCARYAPLCLLYTAVPVIHPPYTPGYNLSVPGITPFYILFLKTQSNALGVPRGFTRFLRGVKACPWRL